VYIGAVRAGQGTLLAAGSLVGRIEILTHLGIMREHAVVKMPGQTFTMLLQSRQGLFHDGNGSRLEHRFRQNK